MLKKPKGEHVGECDECGAEHAGGTLEFKEFIEDLKREGWKISKEDETWNHICPDCQE